LFERTIGSFFRNLFYSVQFLIKKDFFMQRGKSMFRYDVWLAAGLIVLSIVLKLSAVIALYFTYDPSYYPRPIDEQTIERVN
jgi:uncharacterized membrane protein YbhN (UPF0104 family)